MSQHIVILEYIVKFENIVHNRLSLKITQKKNTLSKIFSHTKRSHSLFYENKVNTFPNRFHTSTPESVKMVYLSVIYIQSTYDFPSNFVSRI